MPNSVVRSAWLGAVAAVAVMSLGWACGDGWGWNLFASDKRLDPPTPARGYGAHVKSLVPPSPWFTACTAQDSDACPAQDLGAASRYAGLDSAAIAQIEAGKIPANLPAPAAIYFQGAAAFKAKDYAAAAKAFAIVAAMPQPPESSRRVLAYFMLGRSRAAQGDRAGGIAAFTAARSAAAAGEADPSYLARESLGEEARLHLQAKDYAVAAREYAEQAADGDQNAPVSALITARFAMVDTAALPHSVEDPILQRLMVETAFSSYMPAACLLSDCVSVDNNIPDISPENTGPLVMAVAQAKTKTVGAIQLAQLAYYAGADDVARRLLDGQGSVTAEWLRAKLALKAGNQAIAAVHFSHAFQLAINQNGTEDDFNLSELGGDVATTFYAQGDYAQALETLLQAGSGYYQGAPDNELSDPATCNGDCAQLVFIGNYHEEIALLGERMLSLSALKGFADRAVSGEKSWKDGASLLPDILARRLVRAGQYDEAAAYFRKAHAEPSTIVAVETLAKASRQAAESRGVERARALWASAQVMRGTGFDIAGTYAAPDSVVRGGDFPVDSPTDIKSRADDPWSNRATLAQEKAIFNSNAPVPNRRFHYRYVASEWARQAATEIEPRSQAYAALLCNAAQMLPPWSAKRSDSDSAGTAAPSTAEGQNWEPELDKQWENERNFGGYRETQEIWKTYVATGAVVPFARHFGRQCPAPDFDAIPATKSKLLHIKVHHTLHAAKPAMLPVTLILLVGGVVVFVRRRRSR